MEEDGLLQRCLRSVSNNHNNSWHIARHLPTRRALYLLTFLTAGYELLFLYPFCWWGNWGREAFRNKVTGLMEPGCELGQTHTGLRGWANVGDRWPDPHHSHQACSLPYCPWSWALCCLRGGELCRGWSLDCEKAPHLLDVWPWASYSTPLTLSFLNCKMGIIISTS